MPTVLKHLLDADLIHGDCMTVTGKTMAENLAELDPPAPDGKVVHPLSDPIHARGGIAVLRGTMAPKGAVVKVAGIDFDRFEGPARVFEGEDGAMEAILAGKHPAGRRRRDPLRRARRAARNARDARRHRSDEGCRSRRRLRARHRWTVLRRHPRVLRRPRRPRSGRRRPIAFVRDGDRIVIDTIAHTIDLDVAADELARRKAEWKLPEPRYTSGVLAKYARLAGRRARGDHGAVM